MLTLKQPFQSPARPELSIYSHGSNITNGTIAVYGDELTLSCQVDEALVNVVRTYLKGDIRVWFSSPNIMEYTMSLPIGQNLTIQQPSAFVNGAWSCDYSWSRSQKLRVELSKYTVCFKYKEQVDSDLRVDCSHVKPFSKLKAPTFVRYSFLFFWTKFIKIRFDCHFYF